MKKTLILVTLLLIASFAFAQIPGNIGYNNHQISNRSFGFKGGLNFSNIHGDNVEDTKSKTGFILGLFFEIPRTEQFSLQPEILFSMKGWKYEDSVGMSGPDGVFYYYNYKYWAYLNYVEIPILGKYQLNDINNLKPILYFGPCFGFNVSSTYRIEWEDDDTDTGSMDDFVDMSVFEFSLTPGAMVEINNQFVFDFRYSIGLTDIFSDNDFDPAKNSVISLMLGMKL